MALTIEEQIIAQLDQIRRLLAAVATAGKKQRDQITMLSQAGMQPKDIADLLGTSSNTVRVELVSLRRTKRNKGKKKD